MTTDTHKPRLLHKDILHATPHVIQLRVSINHTSWCDIYERNKIIFFLQKKNNKTEP